MCQTSSIAYLTTLKLLSNIVYKVGIDGRNSSKNQTKSLFSSYASLKRYIKADYFTFNTKKTFNIL